MGNNYDNLIIQEEKPLKIYRIIHKMDENRRFEQGFIHNQGIWEQIQLIGNKVHIWFSPIGPNWAENEIIEQLVASGIDKIDISMMYWLYEWETMTISGHP